MLGARLQGAISPSPASTLPCIAYKRTKAAPPMQHSTTTAAAAAAHGAPAVYCYSGPGAGARSLLSTLHSLRQALVPAVKVGRGFRHCGLPGSRACRALPGSRAATCAALASFARLPGPRFHSQTPTPHTQVASLDAAELLAGGWQEGCLALVMPGGADLPYCKHLNGRGNALITGGGAAGAPALQR